MLGVANGSLLNFPGGRSPGINYAHPAAQNLRMAAVVQGSFVSVNLMPTGRFTDKGGSTRRLRSYGDLGNCANHNGGNSWAEVTGQSTVVDAVVTTAFIGAQPSAGAANRGFIGTNASVTSSGTTGGWWAGTIGSGALIIQDIFSASNRQSGANTFDVPFFAAISASSAATNFVYVNLANGRVSTTTGSGITFTAGSTGGYTMCGVPNWHLSNGYQATAMFSATYLSRQQLLMWAQDPWSFWYPG